MSACGMLHIIQVNNSEQMQLIGHEAVAANEAEGPKQKGEILIFNGGVSLY